MTMRKNPALINKAWRERLKKLKELSDIKEVHTAEDEELLRAYPLVYYANNLAKKSKYL